ncbi:hypothetical protein J2Z40_003030 [Cytobacillus eiseniae]|uniref:Uncharacterized protein n=1 Tax=Cytobacillus eiseniae TaxID=762947 RepID=A0ABS4RJ71_9BACI|nr:hypothetical protein [Cytobacillus eiseniae]MBP2242456.1 hypothetical protein [Cytobacillus eiseniae]
MKKKLLLGTLLGFFTIGIYLGLDSSTSTIEKNSKNMASGVSYNRIEEISNNAQLIIKGQINHEYREVQRKLDEKLVTEKIYKVEVKDVLVNKTDQNIINGSVIEISHATSFNSGVTEYDIVDSALKEIPSGEYLLFLNTIFIDNEVFYVNNSPNHLFQLEDNKYINLVEDTELEILKEENLLKIK